MLNVSSQSTRAFCGVALGEGRLVVAGPTPDSILSGGAGRLLGAVVPAVGSTFHVMAMRGRQGLPSLPLPSRTRHACHLSNGRGLLCRVLVTVGTRRRVMRGRFISGMGWPARPARRVLVR